MHLRRDAAAAEDEAIRFADSTVGRKSGHFAGFGLYDSVTARCRATLDSAVGATHDVAATVVHAYAARRNVLSDIGVLLPYFFAFVTVCWVAGGRTASRIDRDDWLATLLAVGGAIVVLGAAGAALGEIWSTVCEILRAGNAHLSNRTARIPWVRFRGIFVMLSVRVGVGDHRHASLA